MGIQHNIKGSVSVEPIWYDDVIPLVSVKLNDTLLFHGSINQVMSVDFDIRADAGRHELTVELHNKTDKDTIVETGQDKAVIIKEIELFGIKSPRFVWQGIYTPNYPEHMIDQPPELKGQNYLGWNGVWRLKFSAPVFTWIHQTENLGWIYD